MGTGSETRSGGFPGEEQLENDVLTGVQYADMFGKIDFTHRLIIQFIMGLFCKTL
jgi:hypothetical protein